LRAGITISLDKQVQIYSVDTSMFYSCKEAKVHRILNKKYIKRKELKNEVKIMLSAEVDLNDISVETKKRQRALTRTNKQVGKLKGIIKYLFEQNSGKRALSEESLKHKNIISVFESSLTRTLGIPTDALSVDIIVVQSYFFEILKDIVVNGFIFKSEEYILFTASAGQIRTKKTVFIKKELFLKFKNSLMCGLSVESINNSKEKGMNINKFLAYLALSNSASEVWSGFDIRRTIVVDDLETCVTALVDYIDNTTYEIERKEMQIPINHTDGCGIILPRKSKKSFMVRLPWVKGLLVPFPFDKFAKIRKKKCIVKDIYGLNHNVIEEGIEVIFTKSQFKMWKYYSSWKEYQDSFIKYNCLSAKCNEEDDFFSDAKLNYQMLQTLNEMTDEELAIISKDTFKNISNIGEDKNAMLRVLGVTKSNITKSYFQQALDLYPELLLDPFSRETLKDVKKSLVNEAKSGKLNSKGKYTFIIPDLYAFCEKIFWNSKNPSGLLLNGQVHCSLFKNDEKLDCLRSPHLYREHAVRLNVLDDSKKKWYVTRGLYASIHDAISKILQYDCDGDKSLVTSDKTIVECAERHMKDIVPLYYEMAVSPKQELTNENLYSGLVAAYTGGNIGEISNNISKIWNSSLIDLDAVKWLCMENNFVIDYAKTLYKLERPKDKQKKIKNYTKSKLPYFFVYAKDKIEEQVVPINESIVNRINALTPKSRIIFKKDLGLKKLDFKILLSNEEYVENQEIINKYNEFNLKRRFIKITKDNLHIYKEFRKQLLEINNDLSYITNVLVNYLFIHRKSSKKEIMWQSFGDVIVENIGRNLNKYTICEACGEKIEAKQAKRYCADCASNKEKERKKELKLKGRK